MLVTLNGWHLEGKPVNPTGVPVRGGVPLQVLLQQVLTTSYSYAHKGPLREEGLVKCLERGVWEPPHFGPCSLTSGGIWEGGKKRQIILWANSKRWWRTGKPGVLRSMGSQRWAQLSAWTITGSTSQARMFLIYKGDSQDCKHFECCKGRGSAFRSVQKVNAVLGEKSVQALKHQHQTPPPLPRTALLLLISKGQFFFQIATLKKKKSHLLPFEALSCLLSHLQLPCN